MKKTKLIKTIAIICSAIGLASLSFAPALADDCTDICTCPNVSSEVRAAAGCPGEEIGELPAVIQGILNAIIGVSGIVAVIFVIIGGINYMTSSDDAGKLKKAKDTILYALIGLAICALAFAIVNWTIGAIGGANNADATDDADSSQVVKPGDNNNSNNNGPTPQTQ